MSLIDGYLAFDGLNPSSVNPYITPDLDLYTFEPHPVGELANLADSYYAQRLIGTITMNPLVKDGYKTAFYGTDFYNRIHIAPASIALGNLVSAETRTVIVWNAYLNDFKQLTTITESGTEGISYSTVQNPPTFFAPLEEREFVFNIDTVGPSDINASYLFEFDDAKDPVLTITGRRVVSLSFKPLLGFIEKLEWKTDIIPTFNGEQRIGLRTAPRARYEYKFHFNAEEYSRIRAVLNQWAFRPFALPVWMEGTYLGTVTQGVTEIAFDTAFADYRPGSTVAVIDENLVTETAVIDQVFADKITLTLPFAATLTKASIYPVRFATTYNGFAFKREQKGHITAVAEFHVEDNIDLEAAGDKPQYKGLDVLIDCPVMLSDITERIMKSIDLFDNGSGPVVLDIANNILTKLFTATFHTSTKEQRWKLRQFLHKMKGRRGTFWLPSFNADLELLQTAGAGSFQITVKSIGYALYLEITDIAIVMNDGTIYYNTMTNATASGGDEVLDLETALPATIAPADVDKIMFMHKVRFDSDLIEINYPQLQYGRVSAPVREVQE